MKKMIALLMALCLLMTAFGVVAEETRPVVQDEKAPAIVLKDVNGKKVAATIYDTNGNVLAELLDDGSLQLTDVHHRESADDRLGHAYDQLMHDVHFSDVEAIDHDEKLKKDINERISTTELNAYDLLTYEVFDVMINSPEGAALLTDGAYVEFTVELLEGQTAPMLVKFSEDGEHWKLLDSYTVDGKQVTLRLEKQGVVCFIKPYEVVPGTSYTYTYVEEVYGAYPSTSEIDQTIFTPSVSGKPAPELVPTITEDNQIVVGYIYTTESTEPIVLTQEDHLLITPVSESAYVDDVTIYEHLQWSYDDILEAEEVQHIQTDLGAQIDEQLAAGGFEQTHADLVVRDLFDVTYYGDHVEQFYNPETLVELTFEEKELNFSDPLVVLHSHDSINWHVVPIDQVQVNDNDTVTMKLDGMGVVAFLVERGEELPAADQAVSSPE